MYLKIRNTTFFPQNNCIYSYYVLFQDSAKWVSANWDWTPCHFHKLLCSVPQSCGVYPLPAVWCALLGLMISASPRGFQSKRKPVFSEDLLQNTHALYEFVNICIGWELHGVARILLRPEARWGAYSATNTTERGSLPPPIPAVPLSALWTVLLFFMRIHVHDYDKQYSFLWTASFQRRLHLLQLG